MSYRDLAPEDIGRIFTYDPISGEVMKNGKRVGFLAFKNKYRAVHFRGFKVPEHVMAWVLTHGVWPDKQIDHINRNGCDNSLQNLRLAKKGQQQANRRSWAKSGFRGVSFSQGKWAAYIRYNNKTRNLGRYHTKEEAAAVVERERERIWGWFAA